ncbi:MAG: MOSC domain-containing protein [Desulfobulbaceae bacterium]|nr:MAG: MOSC domain-containing protein [Desulfobulbaceae bacterium]
MTAKNGFIEAICISARKGVLKKAVEQALFEKNWGIRQDAHAGVWHRQVSLLAGESIDAVRKKIPGLRHGVFAENLVTRNVELAELTIGDRLCLGRDVVLEVTQIGKKCHNDGCVIKKKTGDCIMPREGLFCKVVKGGDVKVGNSCAPCGFNAEKCITNPKKGGEWE